MSVRSESYPLPRHLVEEALEAATQRSGLAFRIDERNPDILFAETGLSLGSTGERITIRITEHRDRTEVQVKSKCIFQIIDWGRNKENVNRFFQHLHSCLPIVQGGTTDDGQQLCIVCGIPIVARARYCPSCGAQRPSANKTAT